MDPAVLPDSWANTHGSWVAWWLPLALSAVVTTRSLLRASPRFARLREANRRHARRALAATLVVVSLLSVANYVDFGVMRYGTYLNEWATYHYYLGSKYADEIGYTGLYEATIVALAEDGESLTTLPPAIRDLRTGGLERTSRVLERTDEIKSHFSRARYRDFTRDVRWFQSQLPPGRWRIIFQDHGYNPPPAWSMVIGAALTSRLSIRDAASRAMLTAVDPLLLLVGFAAVAWAFRPRVAAYTLILVGTHYLMSWGHMKGMIARTDFAVCTLVAACCVEKKHYGSAGALVAWAVVARVFPIVFLAGPGVQLLDSLRRDRKFPPEWTRFFVSFGFTLLTVNLATFVFFRDRHIWQEWSAKILLHYQMRTDWNIGYQVLVDADFRHGIPRIVEAANAYADDATARGTRSIGMWITRLAVCIPAAFFTRSMRPSDAFLFGFVFLFMLVSAGYYYYIILMVPFVYFARRADEVGGALGTSLFWVTGSLGYLLFAGYRPLSHALPMLGGFHQTYPTYYGMTLLIGLSVVAMLFVGGREAHAADVAARKAGLTG